MTTTATNSKEKRGWPRWAWAAIFTGGGIVTGMAVLFSWMSLKGNPNSRMMLLVLAISLGTISSLLLGLAIRFAQHAIEKGEFQKRRATILIGAGIRLALLAQIAVAAAAVGAGILWGFGYKVPGG